jgi:hypothetical protein
MHFYCTGITLSFNSMNALYAVCMQIFLLLTLTALHKGGKISGLATDLIIVFLSQAIAKDAVLSRCKIVSEPWDCGGLYLVGRFPNWDR